MFDLLSKYSISEILIFIVLLAAALKGAISFLDWGANRIRAVFDKEYKQNQRKTSVQNQLESNQKSIDKITESQVEFIKSLDKIATKVDMLIASDKDDIKSFLTKEHHYYCYQKGWIDDYSLECCERRYKHYVDEGGNSFIKHFMQELRSLPKVPPEKDTIKNV